MKIFFYPSFSTSEVYINTQQTHKSNGLPSDKSYNSHKLKKKQFWNKRVLHSKKHSSEEPPDENIVADAALSDDFLTRRKKNQKRTEGFTLYVNLVLHFFVFSEIQSAEKKVRQQVVRTTANFWMNSDNLNVSFSTAGFSLYLIALTAERTNRNGHACSYFHGVHFFRDSSKKFYHFCHTRKNSSRRKTIDGTIRRKIFLRNTNSAFTGSETDSPFSYQQFILNQTAIPRGGGN